MWEANYDTKRRCLFFVQASVPLFLLQPIRFAGKMVIFLERTGERLLFCSILFFFYEPETGLEGTWLISFPIAIIIYDHDDS